MNIKTFRLDRSILAAFVFGWFLYFAFTYNIKPVNAATNPSGLTGQYGCLLNRNPAGFNTAWTNNDIGTQVVSYIDYSTNKSQGLVASVNDYNLGSAGTEYTKITSDFTETEVPGVKSTYIQEHVIKNASGTVLETMNIVMMVVNSGNTILASQAAPAALSSAGTWSGVCQKI